MITGRRQVKLLLLLKKKCFLLDRGCLVTGAAVGKGGGESTELGGESLGRKKKVSYFAERSQRALDSLDINDNLLALQAIGGAACAHGRRDRPETLHQGECLPLLFTIRKKGTDMNVKQWVWPIAAALSLTLSACGPGYMYGAGSGGYVSVGTGWQSAWYDQEGFPIYGYEGGRPVYGYTPAGAAVFSLSLLTSDCYVPHWEPASWYRGSYRYPARVKRISAPPRHPAAHKPSYRPARPMSRADNPVVRRSNPPAAAPRPNTPPRVNAPSTRPTSPSHRQKTAPVTKQPMRPQAAGKQPSGSPSAGRQPARPQAGKGSQPIRSQQVSRPGAPKPQTGKIAAGDKTGAGRQPGKPSSPQAGHSPLSPSKSHSDRGAKH